MFLLENMWITWLIAAAGFLVLEALTAGLVCIWFVPGAVITSILSVWVDSIAVQIVVFILLSAAFMFFCRKYFNKSRAEKLDDTANKLIGKTATVQTSSQNGEAKVLVGDVYWRAVTDCDITEGESVIITAVNGNVLTVDKK